MVNNKNINIKDLIIAVLFFILILCLFKIYKCYDNTFVVTESCNKRFDIRQCETF